MRKIFLLIMCTTLTYSIFASNCVSTRSVSVDYKNGLVTFELIWTACDNNIHRNQVWVFIDYQEVKNGNPFGDWKPAVITDVYSLMPVTVSSQMVTGNSRGLWITGNNGTKATVTLRLDKSKIPTQYKWCAFATDYPPNAAAYNNGTYTLQGTMPFYINGSTTPINSKKYSDGVVNSITDATGCSGWIERDVPTTSGVCRSGLTLVNGYCRNLSADGASSFTGCNIEVQAVDNPAAVWSLGLCDAAKGWQLPTNAQLNCIWSNRSAFNLGSAIGIWGQERSGHNASCYYCCYCDRSYYSSSGAIVLYLYSAACGPCTRYAGQLALWGTDSAFPYRCVR